MKNFTGKVTDVDNNGNPIKKKSSGKNGKKSGFKKPAAAKKSSGKKPLKDITAVMTKKPVRKIVEYYYFFDEEMDARKLQSAVGEKWFEKADIWPELSETELFTAQMASCRRYTEEWFPKLARALHLKDDWDYKELYLSLLEHLARQYKISRFKIYTPQELLLIIQRKRKRIFLL